MRLFSTLVIYLLTISIGNTCTSYLISKGASVDGSTIISYSADSHIRYGELYFKQGNVYPAGTMMNVYDRGTNKLLGEIPQAHITYNVVGFTNEFQVSVGETTFGGRKELQDTTGILDYGSLMFISLQRAKSAREAIKIIAELVEQYGYYSSGESFSIGDKDEVWIMEIIGKGTDLIWNKKAGTQINRNKGAVWVAIKIPEGYISAHANQARIQKFPLSNGITSVSSKHLSSIFIPTVETIYSYDVIDFAREKKYFDGLDSEFSFSDTYAPVNFEAARFCEMRVWSFFRRFNNNMDQYTDYVSGNNLKHRMPLFIKPDKKVTISELFAAKRDYFQGTEFDMTKDFGAEPYGIPYRWRPLTWTYNGQEYFNERATVTQQTGFSFIAQARSWLPDHIGGLIWFSVDDVGTSVYVPIYCGIVKVPESYAEGNGSMLEYSETSAFWTFNKVANFAYSRYSLMIKDIQKVQSELEDTFIAKVPEIDKAASFDYVKEPEKARNLLTEFSVHTANETVKRWEKLYRFLLVKYIDGNVKQEKDGVFLKNTYGFPLSPVHPGYSDFWKEALIEKSEGKFNVKK